MRRAAAALLGLACVLPTQGAMAWPERLATFRIGGGTPHAIAFAPNGSAFATAGERGDLILWDRKTLKPRWTAQANDHWIGSIAFAPDGRSLATMGREITVWNLAGEKLHARAAGGPNGVAYSHDGRQLAYHSGRGVVNVLDAHSGELVTSFNGQERYPVNCLVFARDDRLVYAGDNGGRVWQLTLATRTERELFSHREDGSRGHAVDIDVAGDVLMSAASNGDVRFGDTRIAVGGAIYAAAVSPDGARIVTGGGEGALHTWSTETGELLDTVALAAGISGLAFSATGDTLGITTYGGRILLRRGEHIEADLEGHPSEIEHVTFSADGSYVVASGVRTVFFAVASGQQHQVSAALALAPGIRGAQVLASGRKTPLALVDAGTAEVLRELSVTGQKPLAVDPSGQLVVLAGSFSSCARLLDLDRDQTIDLERFGRVLDAAWSPDGELLAMGTVSGNHGESGSVEVLDRTGGSLFEQSFACAVSAVAFSPNGETLVYAKGGGSLHERVPPSLHVLEVPGFRERRQIDTDTSVAWWRFLDGETAVAHDYQRLMLWDVATMTVQREVAWPDLWHAALSPDRQLAALADHRTNTVTIVRLTKPR